MYLLLILDHHFFLNFIWGRSNLLGAITIAGHFEIPEVTVFFHNTLFRGNRCSKIDASALDGFDSPNMDPIAM